MSIKAYNNIALILAAQGKTQQAVETFREALEFNEKSDFKSNMANINLSLGIALKRLGRTEQAMAHFDLAIEQYKKFLEKDPESIKILTRLGNALAERARFAEATHYFQRAVALNPAILENHVKTIQAMQFAGRLDSAIEITKNSIQFFSLRNQKQPAEQLKKLLEMLQFRKLQQQQQKKSD